MAGEEEIKKPWPSAYSEVNSVENFDYLMSGRNGEPLSKVDKEKLKQWFATSGQRMKAVPPGELPVGPSDKEMYMQLLSQGTWTFDGNEFVNPESSILSMWWNRFTWAKDDGVSLPSDQLGFVNDIKANVNLDGINNKITINGTFVVIRGKTRIISTIPQEVNLSLNPALLYIMPDGTINTRDTSLISSLPAGAVIFATYSKVTDTSYEISGLKNYSLNNINQLQNNFFNGRIIGSDNSFTFDTGNNLIVLSSTNIVFYNKSRIVVTPQNQSISLPEAPNTHVLYVTQDGKINSVTQSSLGTIPFGSVVIGGFNRSSEKGIAVTGIDNYNIDGLSQVKSNFFNGRIIGSTSSFNFDLVTNKIRVIATIVITFDNKRIIPSPTTQELDIATSGIHIIYITQEGFFASVLQSSISNMPFGAVVIGSYLRGGPNSIYVNGIDVHSINGIPNTYVRTGTGKLISDSKFINIRGQNLEILGRTMLLIGQSRYVVNAQTVAFSSTPSLFYLVPSTGVIGSTLSSSISMPADAIVFGGHYGANAGRRFEFWGIDNYTINGFEKTTWEKKLIQKKFLVDFDPTPHYYKCNTTLSMTSTDPEPLIGSDPNIMKSRYEALVAQYPELVTKENIATITTAMGDRTIDVFTFTPPSVSTAPRPDSGIVVIEQPHLFINCSIHGNEKTASIACYQFLEDVLTKWQSNKILEWFRFNVKLSIIPVANPAGWVNGTRQNASGVDLNRNFPFMYISNQNAGGAQWSGLSALDQPESLAINNWLEANRRSIVLGVDFHNFFAVDGAEGELMWLEGVSQFTNQLGRIAAQRISRGSRDSSPYFPADWNKMLGTASYVTNPRGRLSGQINDLAACGVTFEISQNFRYNPNFKPNDNDAIKLGTEAFGNALTHLTWNCIVDYNSKICTYDNL